MMETEGCEGQWVDRLSVGGQTLCGLWVDEGEDWLMNIFGPCVNKCILQNIIIHRLYMTKMKVVLPMLIISLLLWF